MQLARAAGYESATLYHFPVTLEHALARNAQRSAAQRVPDIAIRGTLAKLEMPRIEEGWDCLVIVRTTGENRYETEEINP